MKNLLQEQFQKQYFMVYDSIIIIVVWTPLLELPSNDLVLVFVGTCIIIFIVLIAVWAAIRLHRMQSPAGIWWLNVLTWQCGPLNSFMYVLYG